MKNIDPSLERVLKARHMAPKGARYCVVKKPKGDCLPAIYEYCYSLQEFMLDISPLKSVICVIDLKYPNLCLDAKDPLWRDLEEVKKGERQ